MLMNNCGEHIHKLVIDNGLLSILVKIVKKKTDLPVRERIFLLLDATQTVLGGASGKFPQYYAAYYELVGATDEFILDLVEQCSFQKQRVMHLVMTSRDEKVVTQAIELNEQLHKILIQHDALLSVRSTSNAVPRNGEEEEEDAECLFRRIRKGKACAEEHSEEFMGSSRLIPEDKMRRPLSIQPFEPDSKPPPTVSIPPPATVVSVPPPPTGSLPPPPAKHLEREKFFKEKQTDASGMAGHMRDLSLHSRNGSSSRSGSADFNEFAYRD